MRRSTDRILVSHAGTLPRPPQIAALLKQGPSGEAELGQKLPAAVKEIVLKQVEVGVDIVNDGEIPKRGTFSSYIQQRVEGIEPRKFALGEGPPPRDVNGRDRRDFPGFFSAGLRGFGPARYLWRGLGPTSGRRRENTVVLHRPAAVC